jgi:hypothetical protein
MLDSFRSTLAGASPTKRIFLLGGVYFLIALLVDVIAVDLFTHPGRPGTTLTRRSLQSYVGDGVEALLFGTLIHFIEAKTSLLSFDESREG